MDMDEGLATKLWLEGYEISPSEIPPDQIDYRSKKFKLSKNEWRIVQPFLKKNHLHWDTLIHAAWGLLLNRFSSADFIFYGTSTLHSARDHTLKIYQPILPCKSLLNDKLPILTCIKKLQIQASKKKNSTNHLSDTHLLTA